MQPDDYSYVKTRLEYLYIEHINYFGRHDMYYLLICNQDIIEIIMRFLNITTSHKNAFYREMYLYSRYITIYNEYLHAQAQKYKRDHRKLKFNHIRKCQFNSYSYTHIITSRKVHLIRLDSSYHFHTIELLVNIWKIPHTYSNIHKKILAVSMPHLFLPRDPKEHMLPYSCAADII